MSKLILILIFSLPLIFVTGCGRGTLGGAAIGAGAAGAAYEYSNKDALDDLERDFNSGRISRDEYMRRKHDIERKSLLY